MMRALVHSGFRATYKLLQIIPGGYAVRQSPAVGAIYRFLSSRLRQRVVRVNGHQMFLDPEDNLQLSTRGIHEPLTTQLFRTEVRKGDVVLDIGAHIGYYTLLSARMVGEQGKVFAFEANPANFALLEKNIKVNGYRNVTPVQKAVSNTSGKARLFLEKSSNTRWSSIYDIHGSGKSFEVDVTTIDQFLKDYKGVVNFIKIDIEGAELAALEGMSNLLDRNKRLKIITEFRPSLLERAGIDPRKFLRFFVDHGFKIYYADEVHGEVKPASEEGILQFCVNYEAANLLCVRDADDAPEGKG